MNAVEQLRTDLQAMARELIAEYAEQLAANEDPAADEKLRQFRARLEASIATSCERAEAQLAAHMDGIECGTEVH